MAIPAYLWLKDDSGANIKGSVDVKDREGSIEITSLFNSVEIPTDNNTGKITGTRQLHPYAFLKEIDSSSVYLYQAVTTGKVLKSASLNSIESMTLVRRRNMPIPFLKTSGFALLRQPSNPVLLLLGSVWETENIVR